MRAAAIILLLCFCAEASGATPPTEPTTACRAGMTPRSRVELFFGAEHVGVRAWSRFLATIVTPRFPDGLTSYDAHGQWRGPRGLKVERSRVLVIYYVSTPATDSRIEAVRAAYKRRFSQGSVLRADSFACVSF